ncbi:MAG: hypothetical protein HN423_08140, partial [Alphaproteobacteria bacterium]|nr:hypothetical protein [Alphaproteobacteria bacterium]
NFVAEATNNTVRVTDRGGISASSATLFFGNTIQLESGGVLDSSGAFSQEAGTVLEMGISGATGLDHGHLAAAGALSVLDGTLMIVLDGYSPDSGAVFTLFDWGAAAADQFAELDFPGLTPGLVWNADNLYSVGSLEVMPYSHVDGDGDGIEDGWEYQYFFQNVSPSNNPDLDPHDNLAEFIAGTDPTNGASFFHITNAVPIAAGFVVEWDPSVGDREYSIFWTNELTGVFQSLETGIEFPQNSYTDTTHAAEGAGFYQIDVQLK